MCKTGPDPDPNGGKMNLSRTLLLPVGLLAAVVLAGCSESGSEPTPALPTAETAPTATPVPTPSPSPTPSPEPAAEPEATPAQTGVLFDYLYAVRLIEAAQWRDAIGAFGLVIRRLPEYGRAYFGRGLAYYNEEQLAPALEDFDRAIELEPTLAQAYMQRGMLHRDEGRTELAVSDLERALDLYQRRGHLTRAVEVAQLLDELR